MSQSALPHYTPVHEQEVPRAVLDKAQQAVKDFHECFWWWNDKLQLSTWEHVREVVDALRKNGGHRAWYAAQEIQKQCR